MAEQITHRVKNFEINTQKDLYKILNVILDDLTNMQTDIAALDTAIDTMAAKLNLDAGVTDVDYAGALSAMTTATLNTEA